VLLVVGLLLAGSSPGLAAGIATDPGGAIAMTLPIWFLVPFAVVAVLGLVGGAVIDIYSSGLALLAAGLRVPRPAAAAIDGVIMIAGTVYVVFIAGHFLGEFTGFLITLGVPIAAWCGVILADVLVRRSDYDDNDLYRPAGRYGDVRVGPIVLIVLATVLGWGLVTNAGAEWLQWQGYLLGPIGGRQGEWAGANLGVLVALVVPFAVTLLADHARTEHARRRVAEPVPRFRQA
jgi:nucleobase:cation symporter-1, NCS1 family